MVQFGYSCVIWFELIAKNQFEWGLWGAVSLDIVGLCEAERIHVL